MLAPFEYWLTNTSRSKDFECDATSLQVQPGSLYFDKKLINDEVDNILQRMTLLKTIGHPFSVHDLAKFLSKVSASIVGDNGSARLVPKYAT